MFRAQDVVAIDPIFIAVEKDEIVDPVGVKGSARSGITGAAAAIANAVFNATGKRIRSLPITPDKLFVAWAGAAPGDHLRADRVGKDRPCRRAGGEARREIVSADSQQCYRGLDAGTAKPSPEERSRARHHLLDVADPEEQLDAARFVQLADAAMRTSPPAASA